MITARSIVCVAPADPPRLSLRDMSARSPGRDEVLVEQIASSINPIDVKRAGATFDAHGWVRGAWRVRGALRAARKRVAARSPAARYSWVVFRPAEEALDRLLAFFTSGLRLPVGWTGTVEDASTGFQRVADGAPGRSVLLLGSPPQGRPSPSGSEHSAMLAAQP